MKNNPDFRLQDVVSRVAGVSLANTSRVLESLYEVCLEIGEPDMRSTLRGYLIQGSDGHGLSEKPNTANSNASELVYSKIRDRLGIRGLRDVISTDHCKFAEMLYDGQPE